MAVELTHSPVLLDEVLQALEIDSNGCYVDATFGRGGHSKAILARLAAKGRLIALDRDPAAIAAGRELVNNDERVRLVHSDFGHLVEAVREANAVTQPMDGGLQHRKVLGNEMSGREINGILFDFGVSSPQLDDAARGFSFMQDGPLDMRMDNSRGVTAAEWLAHSSEQEIIRVLFEYGEEKFARRIARAICESRKLQPINTTSQLVELIEGAVPRKEPGKHPATRTFQAIRIQVNNELKQIEHALEQSLAILAPGGRLCAISFHSLEDRIVKEFIQRHSQDDPVYAGLPFIPEHARPKLKRVSKAIHPSQAEIDRNPRARSAILRVAEKMRAAA
jgi:16S rRNA (cytosine1402-N4)-methyltransferase